MIKPGDQVRYWNEESPGEGYYIYGEVTLVNEKDKTAKVLEGSPYYSYNYHPIDKLETINPEDVIE